MCFSGPDPSTPIPLSIPPSLYISLGFVLSPPGSIPNTFHMAFPPSQYSQALHIASHLSQSSQAPRPHPAPPRIHPIPAHIRSPARRTSHGQSWAILSLFFFISTLPELRHTGAIMCSVGSLSRLECTCSSQVKASSYVLFFTVRQHGSLSSMIFSTYILVRRTRYGLCIFLRASHGFGFIFLVHAVPFQLFSLHLSLSRSLSIFDIASRNTVGIRNGAWKEPRQEINVL